VNPDLPQFEHGLEGWSEISLAYDLAPYAFAVPVAVQIWGKQARVLATGVITSTEDQFDPASTNNDRPTRSIIYFSNAEAISITWAETQAVLAMVAVATGTGEENGEGQQ